MKSKEELIEELNQIVQQTGTLTVLHSNTLAHKVGLSATEFEALDIIRNNQPLTAGRLATYCGLTTGAITGIVDRLEQAKFVTRKSDPNDRRRVLLQIIDAPKMKREVYALYEPLCRAFNAIVKDYSPQQLQFLVDNYSALNNEIRTIILQVRQK